MKRIKNIFTHIILLVLIVPLSASSCHQEKAITESGKPSSNNKYTLLSEQLLLAVKENKRTETIQEELELVSPDSLAAYLKNDSQKKAFWINIYNANIQLLLSEKPDLFENRGKFFGNKRIKIAQEGLSFDDIEHGIIRGSQFKLALGLIKNPFAGSFEKQFRTRKRDGRIHFALNCGAKSCPRIAIYSASNFDRELDEVAQSFLQEVCTFNEEENRVYVSALFSWFRGDFGGRKGSLNLLKKYEILGPEDNPDISYTSYDWSLSLGNYYEKN